MIIKPVHVCTRRNGRFLLTIKELGLEHKVKARQLCSRFMANIWHLTECIGHVGYVTSRDVPQCSMGSVVLCTLGGQWWWFNGLRLWVTSRGRNRAPPSCHRRALGRGPDSCRLNLHTSIPQRRRLYFHTCRAKGCTTPHTFVF